MNDKLEEKKIDEHLETVNTNSAWSSEVPSCFRNSCASRISSILDNISSLPPPPSSLESGNAVSVIVHTSQVGKFTKSLEDVPEKGKSTHNHIGEEDDKKPLSDDDVDNKKGKQLKNKSIVMKFRLDRKNKKAYIIQHQNKLYSSQVCQKPSTINDMPTNQNPFAADLHNMNIVHTSQVGKFTKSLEDVPEKGKSTHNHIGEEDDKKPLSDDDDDSDDVDNKKGKQLKNKSIVMKFRLDRKNKKAYIIQHQNKLYSSQVCQKPSTINDMPTNQNPFAADLHNMNIVHTSQVGKFTKSLEDVPEKGKSTHNHIGEEDDKKPLSDDDDDSDDVDNKKGKQLKNKSIVMKFRLDRKNKKAYIIQHQNKLYSSQVCQKPSTINDMPTNQNPFAADLHNMNNVSNQSSIQPPIDIHSNFQEDLKIETPAMKEEISCQQSEMVQESMTISPSTENIPQVTQTESIKQEDVKTEENCVPENKPTVNSVDKIGVEDEKVHIQMCIRNGCVNRAVNNPEWEQEFCSNECLIIHCRNVFTAWVKDNETNSQ